MFLGVLGGGGGGGGGGGAGGGVDRSVVFVVFSVSPGCISEHHENIPI